jgi:hypothetical protein
MKERVKRLADAGSLPVTLGNAFDDVDEFIFVPSTADKSAKGATDDGDTARQSDPALLADAA